MTSEQITKNVDAAMSKLQLLTSLFESDTDTNLCHEGIMYVVDGIAHDLGNIYDEILEGYAEKANA